MDGWCGRCEVGEAGYFILFFEHCMHAYVHPYDTLDGILVRKL